MNPNPLYIKAFCGEIFNAFFLNSPALKILLAANGYEGHRYLGA